MNKASITRESICSENQSAPEAVHAAVSRDPAGSAWRRCMVDRRLDAIQCIEAIRIYGAAHGKLPAGLEDITEAPVPLDVGHGAAVWLSRPGRSRHPVGTVPARRAGYPSVHDQVRAEMVTLTWHGLVSPCQCIPRARCPCHLFRRTFMTTISTALMLLILGQAPAQPAADTPGPGDRAVRRDRRFRRPPARPGPGGPARAGGARVGRFPARAHRRSEEEPAMVRGPPQGGSQGGLLRLQRDRHARSAVRGCPAG